MDRMAILINSLGSGGAERAVTVLLEEFNRIGLPVILICLEKNVFFSPSPEIPTVFISGSNRFLPRWLKPLELIVHAIKLKSYVNRNDIRLVQSHLYWANYINVLAKLIGSKHRAHIVNAGQASFYRKNGLKGRLSILLIRLLYSRADRIVAKSEGMRKDLESMLHSSNRIKVIYNPYNLAKIVEKAHEEVTEEDFANNRKVLISVGRLIPLKRQSDILLAFSHLTKKNRDLRLVFLGDGPERDRLKQVCVELEISERVTFLGNVKNPYKYMARSYCLVSASESEGFPNVLVEAIACNCPVISSDCASGPREILARGTEPTYHLSRGLRVEEAGILFAVGDVQAMIEGIEILLKQENLREQLVTNGGRRIQEFHINNIGEQYRQLALEKGSVGMPRR